MRGLPLAERKRCITPFLRLGVIDSRVLLRLSIDMAQKNLNAAKTAKKDEFYTQLTDIERELQHYWPHFRDKVVLCNCSEFYYFLYYQSAKSC